jgi:hypothetical protein
MYIFSGDEKPVNLTPRQLNKNYHLDTMFIGVRRAKLEPDGISYRVDPASPIIYSNRFIGGIPIIKSIFLYNHSSSLVDYNDSPTTWNFNEHKLNILKTIIINEGVPMHRNNSCKLEFVLLVTFRRREC